MARPRPASSAVLVVGLGRFGSAVANPDPNGHEVLGVAENATPGTAHFDRLTQVVQADSTDTETLRQLGVADFERAVVGIGGDVEASVLTVMSMVELGVGNIWARRPTRATAGSSRAPEPILSSIPRREWGSGWPIW